MWSREAGVLKVHKQDKVGRETQLYYYYYCPNKAAGRKHRAYTKTWGGGGSVHLEQHGMLAVLSTTNVVARICRQLFSTPEVFKGLAVDQKRPMLSKYTRQAECSQDAVAQLASLHGKAPSASQLLSLPVRHKSSCWPTCKEAAR